MTPARNDADEANDGGQIDPIGRRRRPGKAGPADPDENVKEKRKAGTRAGLTKPAIVAAGTKLIESIGASELDSRSSFLGILMMATMTLAMSRERGERQAKSVDLYIIAIA